MQHLQIYECLAVPRHLRIQHFSLKYKCNALERIVFSKRMAAIISIFKNKGKPSMADS